MSLYNQFFDNVKNNKVQLFAFSDEERLEHYIRAIYTTMLEYVGMNMDSIKSYTKDLVDDGMIDVEGKTNEEILKEIREDILNELRKDFNYLCFEDKDSE